MRRVATFGLALSIVGCIDIHADHRLLVNAPLELSQTAFVIAPQEPLHAIGPFNEVCLGLPADYGLGAEDAPNRSKLRLPGGGFAAPNVTLVRPDGVRDTFPVASFTIGGQARDICFERRPPRDLTRRYGRMELSSDSTIRILRVRWSAGNRYGSP